MEIFLTCGVLDVEGIWTPIIPLPLNTTKIQWSVKILLSKRKTCPNLLVILRKTHNLHFFSYPPHYRVAQKHVLGRLQIVPWIFVVHKANLQEMSILRKSTGQDDFGLLVEVLNRLFKMYISWTYEYFIE